MWLHLSLAFILIMSASTSIRSYINNTWPEIERSEIGAVNCVLSVNLLVAYIFLCMKKILSSKMCTTTLTANSRREHRIAS
jgi:hypothetical protein